MDFHASSFILDRKVRTHCAGYRTLKIFCFNHPAAQGLLAGRDVGVARRCLRVFFLGYKSDCRAGKKQREYPEENSGKFHRNPHEAEVSVKADFSAVTAVTGPESLCWRSFGDLRGLPTASAPASTTAARGTASTPSAR